MPGESAEFQIKLTPLNGFSAPCTLSVAGFPDADSITFDPKVLVPSDSSQLTVHINHSTPPDSYSLVITGKNNKLSHSDTSILVVGISDFTIEITPQTQTVMAGDSAQFQIKLTSLNEFSAPCTLSIVGFPEGDSVVLESEVLVPTDSCRLTIYTTFSTPRDTYQLTVTGKSNNLSHDAQSLMILPQEKVTDFYPLAIGNSWTYAFLGPGGYIWMTFAYTIDTAMILDGNFGYLTSDMMFLYVKGDTIFSLSSATKQRDILLLGPLVIGQSWSDGLWNYELTGFGATTLISNSVRYDNCLKIRKTQPDYPKDETFEWWAKSVGKVKVEEYLDGKYQGGMELISFIHP